jgi:hypothetical protein
MWRYIKGVRDASASPYNSCIRLDGANDYLTLGNSPFYNVGTGEFTFVFSILPLTYTIASNTSPKAIWRKGLSTNIARIVCNFSNTNSGLSLVLIDAAGVQDSLSIPFSNVPLYTFSTIVITRRGTNFAPSTNAAQWPDSIRNPANYKIYVNGVSKAFSYTMNNPAGLVYQVDNNEEFVLGNRDNVSDAFFYGFFDFFSMYDRALSADEILDATAGTFPDEGAKGIFNFNQNTSDSSSVANNMTLLNNSELPIRTYPKTDGLIVFGLGSAPSSVKVFTYPEPLQILNLIKLEQVAYSVSWSLDNVNWTTFPAGSNNVNPININLPANTPLYIRRTNATSNLVYVYALDY